ncbi:hypothetical protein J4221_04380 [Candidatus Pacearchaeota archaeon]|nr:hypothetical protein [Candidatus Pacearchaeota archaeon]
MKENFFKRLRKGRKIIVQREDGSNEQFIYNGRMKGTYYLAKRMPHTLGDILELRIDSSHEVRDNRVIVSDSVSGYIYGSWHSDYESKNKLLMRAGM